MKQTQQQPRAQEKGKRGHMLPQYAGKAQAAQQPAKETREEPQREARQAPHGKGGQKEKSAQSAPVREEQTKGKQKKRGRAKNPVKIIFLGGVGEIASRTRSCPASTSSSRTSVI